MSMLIHQARALGLPTKNVILGEKLDRIITGYDTAEFASAFVASIMNMIEKPACTKFTSDDHIKNTQSAICELEKITIIAPFARFTVSLIDHLKRNQKWNGAGGWKPAGCLNFGQIFDMEARFGQNFTRYFL